SFYFGRSSGFVDCDIACPVPRVPESLFRDFDWFLTLAKHARLLSRAWTSLFSVGVAGKPRGYYASVIDRLSADLEQWRLSIPANWRPGEHFTAHQLQETGHRVRPLALWTLFLYNGFHSLLRARLHLTIHFNRIPNAETQTENTKQLMETSPSIFELLSFIDAEPHTPLWLLAGIPVLALFVLFDLVINNPRHPSTSSNLALLDMAGGHFSRIEYASGGSLPGSLIAEFAHIAREYVNDLHRSGAAVPVQGAGENSNSAPAGAMATG
ncbi:hypothetical protein C8A05DRAFT_20490, partial [Staphylotrichum tortipilum]